MSLKNLLLHFGDFSKVPIEVDFVRDWLLENGFAHSIEYFGDETIDTTVMRGQLVEWDIQPAAYGETQRHALVNYSTDQSVCWQRLVMVKEMMHLMDDPAAATATENEVIQLMQELAGPGMTNHINTKPLAAEREALLKALCALCPVHMIDSLRADYDSELKTDYDIALFFKVPELYIEFIFEPAFATVCRMYMGQNVTSLPAASS